MSMLKPKKKKLNLKEQMIHDEIEEVVIREGCMIDEDSGSYMVLE